jgi:hypothetical protein
LTGHISAATFYSRGKMAISHLEKRDPADTLFEILEGLGAPLKNKDCKIKKLS